MAIVVDLNGSPPGRAGNQVGVDPHNMSKAEYSFQNDGVRSDVSIGALAIGANQILGADGTRGVVQIINPAGNQDIAVSQSPMTSANSVGAITIFAGTAHTWKGPLARNRLFAYSPIVQSLTILVG